MFTITVGTEKQVAYANDIIRKPIVNVEKHIAEIEHDAAIVAEKFGQRLVDLDNIPILRDAISRYEKIMDDSADTLTAKAVIEAHKESGSYFQRVMWRCLSRSFKAAGFDGEISRVANWAAP